MISRELSTNVLKLMLMVTVDSVVNPKNLLSIA